MTHRINPALQQVVALAQHVLAVALRQHLLAPLTPSSLSAVGKRASAGRADASTATIAKEAEVSNGTLFVYFATKPELINALYVSLKGEMGRVAATGLSVDASPREQLHTMWARWIGWATADPDKRQALAHLSVAEDITEKSRHPVHEVYAGIAELLRTITADGPMRAAPPGFVATLMSAIADATIDDLIQNPDPTGSRSDLAFDAMWRALAG